MFNAFKHHAGFTRQFVLAGDYPAILSGSKFIGNCQLDFYYGSLSVESITGDIVRFLSSIGVTDKNSYKEFLDNHGGYYAVELSDQSRWILRWGMTEERFIHLHPARKSPETLRMSGSALKTALAVVSLLWAGKIENTLDHVNAVRVAYLDLPPVKKLRDMKAVERLKRIAFGELDNAAVKSLFV
jgi:hypothetical protein